MRRVGIGLAALVVGAGAFAVLKAVFQVERRGAYYAPAALFIYGLGQTVWGIGTFCRTGRLNRMAREREEPPLETVRKRGQDP